MPHKRAAGKVGFPSSDEESRPCWISFFDTEECLLDINRRRCWANGNDICSTALTRAWRVPHWHTLPMNCWSSHVGLTSSPVNGGLLLNISRPQPRVGL